MKKHYQHWKNNIYKRKNNSQGIEDAEYLEWDHVHNDVEAYNCKGKHIGSLSTSTLKLYKKAIPGRTVPKY